MTKICHFLSFNINLRESVFHILSRGYCAYAVKSRLERQDPPLYGIVLEGRRGQVDVDHSLENQHRSTSAGASGTENWFQVLRGKFNKLIIYVHIQPLCRETKKFWLSSHQWNSNPVYTLVHKQYIKYSSWTIRVQARDIYTTFTSKHIKFK